MDSNPFYLGDWVFFFDFGNKRNLAVTCSACNDN